MVSPERRACSRAAVRDFSDGSIPVTLAPSAASVSARMPPPQPTSRTRFPPNPPSTRRKYSTRTAFSSCSPANGPSSLHHTPGTRSTRRSYFSGSERPPRRGSCSDMGTNLWRGGSWGSTEFFGAAACRAFDDVHGGGERRASRLRGEPVALVIWESFCDPVDRQGEFVTFAPRMKPFVPGHARKNTGWRTWSWDRFGAWRVTTTRSTSPNLPQPPQPPSGSRFHVGERRHLEEPQPRQARVLVHLDEQQVSHAHHGGNPLAPHTDMEHGFVGILFHRERGVHLDRRHARLRFAPREHDASVLGGLRNREGVAGADIVRPGDDVHAVDAAARDVDHHERAVAALQVHRPIEPRRLPRALTDRKEDVGLRVPPIGDLGQLAREWLDPCFELHREPAFQLPRRAGNIGRTFGGS